VNREPASKKDLELTRVELGEKIDEVKADVALMKADVTVLKEDVKVLKVDVAGLKQHVTGLKKDMKEVRTDIAILIVQTSQNTADLHEFKELNKRQMDTVITAIDGLARMYYSTTSSGVSQGTLTFGPASEGKSNPSDPLKADE
jgi:predicted  nucleic acid-binding Zn-ribbon protein